MLRQAQLGRGRDQLLQPGHGLVVPRRALQAVLLGRRRPGIGRGQRERAALALPGYLGREDGLASRRARPRGRRRGQAKRSRSSFVVMTGHCEATAGGVASPDTPRSTGGMARIEERLPENAAGEFYVDASCIDCATCRLVAPAVFGSLPRGLAYVHRQPETEAERHRARMALVACPTASIGTVHRTDAADDGRRAFPEPLEDDVYYCGYAAESSFGASSYLIVAPGGQRARGLPARGRPAAAADRAARRRAPDVPHPPRRRGRPRALPPALRLRARHARGRRDRGTRRRRAQSRGRGRRPARRRSRSSSPFPATRAAAPRCSTANRFLFTGDHLMGSEDGAPLYASRGVCWYSWPEQIRSMERLLDFSLRVGAARPRRPLSRGIAGGDAGARSSG